MDELVRRPHVEHLHEPGFHARLELRARHRIHAVARIEVRAHDLANLGDVVLADSGRRRHQIEDGARRSIMDELAAQTIAAE